MEAMFTATPVTVPARCLRGKETLHQCQLPALPPCPSSPSLPYLSFSSPLIRLQGSFTWMY